MEYDSANCLTKYNGEDVIYDVKGNMTYGPVDGKMTELTYDCRNRLVKAGNVSYTYDCKNTRIATEEDGITTEYVTDTGGSLSRMLIAYENVGTDKSSETHYFYGAEGLSCQNNDSTGQYFSYHYDNIGSTTLITDKTGRKVEEFAYGTYGELLTEVVNNIRFLYNGSYGVVTDSNGLYYMRARYYNPDIKRFINQDIKVGNITNGQSLNRYAYCEGNPVSMVDPFGLCGQSALFNEFFSLGVHLVLGGLGMIPAGGNLFDLADAAFSYCYDKDPVGAGVSLACALPWTGIVAGAGKFGKNAIKLSDKKLDVIKGSRRVVNTTDMAADTVKVGREMKRLGIMDNLGRVFVKSEKIGDFLKNGGEVLKRVAGALKKGDDLYTSVRKLAKGSDQYVSNIKKKNRGFAYWPFGKTSYGKSSSISGADNIADAARLKEYYKQAEKYGTGSIKELENGRFRFYEEIKPARTNGEMAGARHVREWDPYTGLKRDWYETIDHNGNIRQVRPDPNITGGVKVHYMFDSEGKYIGKWSPE